MERTDIESRIHASIRPQLIKLEELFDQYAPKHIGKHHPLYDSPLGKAHHHKRTNSGGGFFVAYINPAAFDRLPSIQGASWHG